jgi:hypothetical protein
VAVGEADRGGGESGVTQIGATSLAAARVGSVEEVVGLVVYAFLGGMAGLAIARGALGLQPRRAVDKLAAAPPGGGEVQQLAPGALEAQARGRGRRCRQSGELTRRWLPLGFRLRDRCGS